MLTEAEIQSWTPENLILEVWHELNQKSSIAQSYAALLTNEAAYGFVNEEQKRAIFRLQQEIERIREVTLWLDTWQQGRSNSPTK